MAKKQAPGAPHPLQELREALGLSREEMAKRLGTSRPFISMVEGFGPERKRTANLGRETLLRCVDLFRTELARLGITAEDLMRGTRDRSGENDGAAA